MSLVTGLLPVAQGVAVHAALKRYADSLRARGDSRTRNQAEAPGWTVSACRDGPAPTIRSRTPTGHTYESPTPTFVGGSSGERRHALRESA